MFAFTALAIAQLVSPATSTARGHVDRLVAAEEAEANDNRRAGGHLANGVLTLDLEMRRATWPPEPGRGGALPVYAFAEVGRMVEIPGPLVRVPAGTRVHATIHNALTKLVRLRGFQDHASAELDTIDVAPGATRVVDFNANVPGTYYYAGRTDGDLAGTSTLHDSQLAGAFIVDPPRTAPPKGERVLVITHWADTLAALGPKSEAAVELLARVGVPRERWISFAVNGRSWPYTERLSYSVGDTVRWRVVNFSRLPHPMHLHGFYYDVLSRGDGVRDTLYSTGQERKVVTEALLPLTTMSMRWVPSRAGNWLFHCHIIDHIDAALRLEPHAGEHMDPHANHALEGMAGLVTGIHISPASGVTLAAEPASRTKLRLFVTERPKMFRDSPAYSFVLQRDDAPPARDSVLRLSSTIFLRQHEPTQITVINGATKTASVHWHGIELESFYDGVGGWSGWGSRVAPPIAPGDSFVVRLTPDRAGTFIYHTHFSEPQELSGGLYGPLIVIPEHGDRDTTDRLFLFGVAGRHVDAAVVINGADMPDTVFLTAGVTHRFRFINIEPALSRTVTLLAGTARQQWRSVAKDGADLPARQATTRPATITLFPGETYDFDVRREKPERLTLEVATTSAAAGFVPIVRSVPIVVR